MEVEYSQISGKSWTWELEGCQHPREFLFSSLSLSLVHARVCALVVSIFRLSQLFSSAEEIGRRWPPHRAHTTNSESSTKTGLTQGGEGRDVTNPNCYRRTSGWPVLTT